jgi:UDP-N-acetylglucosamine 2-epimerase
MAPVVLELRARRQIETIVCVSGQHREMLDDALEVFNIQPDIDLDVMKPDQALSATVVAILDKLSPLIARIKPSRVLVQGDTTTTFAAAMAGFYLGVPVGHVEAGLRTGNMNAPWPEEFNRRSVDLIADLLWAPTNLAADALRREGAPASNILITGNTVVDALRLIKKRVENDTVLTAGIWKKLPQLYASKKLILVTGHRRENFAGGLARVCHALNSLSARPDTEIVWPIHPNPNIMAVVERELRRGPNIHLTSPVDYVSFVALMMRSYLIVTDSGGIQEEAPTLAKPVLITREVTERSEVIAVGSAQLVGTAVDRIVQATTRLLDDPKAYLRMANVANPYGDGHAAQRIVDSMVERYRLNSPAGASSSDAAVEN